MTERARDRKPPKYWLHIYIITCKIKLLTKYHYNKFEFLIIDLKSDKTLNIVYRQNRKLLYLIGPLYVNLKVNPPSIWRSKFRLIFYKYWLNANVNLTINALLSQWLEYSNIWNFRIMQFPTDVPYLGWWDDSNPAAYVAARRADRPLGGSDIPEMSRQTG